MNILEVLDRPIAFQRAFVRVTGSINAALMLSQAVYWTQRVSLEGGWFYTTQAEWEDETGLTRREQDGARKILLALGVLVEEKRGVPRKIFYQVQVDILRQLCTKAPDCMHHRGMKVGTKAPAPMHQTAKLYAPKRQSNTETTQRLLTEIKSSSKAKPSTDERFASFRELYENYFKNENGVAAPWDVKEAANLSRWLKKNPTITREQWFAILENRARSPVNNAMVLSAWIEKAFTWLSKPAGEYGNGRNGTSGTSKIEQAGENLRAAIAGRIADHARAGGDGVLPGSGAAEGVSGDVREAPVPRIPARRARVPCEARGDAVRGVRAASA
jgi:hypothetical protein